MCGIVGVFAFNNAEEKKQAKKREAMTFLFTELLQETQIRGKDATGVSALFEDGNFVIQKGGVPADEFISNYGDSNSNYNSFVEFCRTHKEPLKLLVGHCRKSSVGSNFNNSNNHPICAGEIIGVHNGTLTNHETVFKKLDCERDGTVDSEAIMRLLQVYTKDCTEPFTVDMLADVACHLDGAFSVIAYNANNPYQVALMRRQRPLEIIIIKSLKLMVIVSEKIFFDKAMHEFNKYARLYKSGFSVLEKKDIECAVLPLDNVAVVDLTAKMDDATKIEDLIDKVDTFKLQKYWQKAVTTTNTYSAYNNNNFTRTSNVGKKNESVTKSADNLPVIPQTTTVNNSTAKDQTTFAGKIFSKELNRYVDATKADGLSNVNSTIFTNNSVQKVEVTPTTKNETSTKFTEVVGLTVREELKPVDIAICGATERTQPVNTPVVAAATVDDSKSTEYSKLAQLAALSVRKFANEEEVVKFLQAESSLNLKALPLQALANRIINKVYEGAYLDGLECGLALNNPPKDATKTVRIAKHITKLFGRVLGLVCTNRNDMIMPMESTIKELNLTELTRENMQSLFSQGDLQANIGLIELVKIINRQNGKNTNTSSI